MSVTIKEISVSGYEKVIYAEDDRVGLKCFIAIHSTVLGPALGGTRIYPYATDEAALTDVLRLAEGMTYKSSIAGGGVGGGKSVIVLDPQKKTSQVFHAFGEVVNSLQGKYICSEDSGCHPDDLLIIGETTSYVAGLGLPGCSGDPSRYTAWGTVRGMQAVMFHLDGSPSLEGKIVAIQGVGSVGADIAERLFWLGARLVVSDVVTSRAESVAQRYGARVVDFRAILEEECDIFAPCAMGGVLNAQSIPNLQCRAVAGCANNQLDAFLTDAWRLKRRGILLAPDYIINSGGLINVQEELVKEGYSPIRARTETDKIYDRLLTIFQLAENNDYTPDDAALQLAKYRLRYSIGKRTTPLYTHYDRIVHDENLAASSTRELLESV